MATTPVQLPSGSWRVRAQITDTPDGKQHYKSFTHKDKKVALMLAAQYEATQQEARQPENMTVGAAIDAYISSRTAILSPTTLRSYLANRRTNFQPIESIRLRDLKSRQIQVMINRLASEKSPKTVRNVYALLTAALREFHPDFHPDIDLPRRTHHEISIPEKSDISLLLSSTQGTPMESAILLAAGYGLRRGEISALLWSDIDQTKCTISVSKSMAKAADSCRWLVKSPKSYAGTRTLSVSPNLIDRLQHNRIPGSDRVCPLTPDSITMRFQRLTARLGLDIHFHALRHYNASIMLALAIPDKYQMARLGQSTPGLVKAVYQHIMSDKDTEVSNTMNSAFDDMIVM